MFAKCLEKYEILSGKWHIVSRLFAFLITLFSIFSLFSNLRAGYNVPEYVRTESLTFWTANAFHVLIIILFCSRFFLLFSKTKKSFWFENLFWFSSLITLYIWSVFTLGTYYGIFEEFFRTSSNHVSFCMYCRNGIFPNAIFVNTSNSLEVLYFLYFFFSPIKRIFTFISAFIRSR